MTRPNAPDDFDAKTKADIPWLNLTVLGTLASSALLVSLLLGALQLVDTFVFGILLMSATLVMFVSAVLLFYSAPDPAEYERKARTQARESRGIFVTLSKVIAASAGCSMLGGIAAIWISGQGGKELELAKLDNASQSANNEAEKAPGLKIAGLDIGNPKDGQTKVLPRHLDPAIKDGEDKDGDKSNKEPDGQSIDDETDDNKSKRISLSKLARRRKWKRDANDDEDWTPQLLSADYRVNPHAVKVVSRNVVVSCVSRAGFFIADRHMLRQSRAMRIVHAGNRYPAYVIEELNHPELALIATDYAPFKPHVLSDQDYGEQQAVTLITEKTHITKLFTRLIDGDDWAFVFGKLPDRGRVSGYLKNADDSFLGHLVHSNVEKVISIPLTPAEIVRLPKEIRHLRTQSLSSIAKSIPARNIRKILSGLEIPLEPPQSALSPPPYYLELEIGSPRETGETVKEGVMLEYICRNFNRAGSNGFFDFEHELPYHEMTRAEIPVMIDASAIQNRFSLVENGNEVIFTAFVKSNDDKAGLVCQLLDDEKEVNRWFASELVHDWKRVPNEILLRRVNEFQVPENLRSQIVERAERVFLSHLERPHRSNIGIAFLYCRLEPKLAFEKLAELVRKTKKPEQVPRFVAHAVAETGIPEGFEIVRKWIPFSGEGNQLFSRMIRHGEEAEQAVIDGVDLAKQHLPRLFLMKDGKSVPVDREVLLRHQARTLNSLVYGLALEGRQLTLAAFKRWQKDTKMKEHVGKYINILENRLKGIKP